MTNEPRQRRRSDILHSMQLHTYYQFQGHTLFILPFFINKEYLDENKFESTLARLKLIIYLQ